MDDKIFGMIVVLIAVGIFLNTAISNYGYDKIISELDLFWTKEQDYLDRGEAHKRGYLLWGAPGGGKTCLVSFIVAL